MARAIVKHSDAEGICPLKDFLPDKEPQSTFTEACTINQESHLMLQS